MSATQAPSQLLPETVRQQIAEYRRRYPTSRAVLLPALHAAQKANGGWLSDAVIEAVALELALPASDVYGVVSFYDLYHQKPVGRHRIRVCTNVSCMLRGSDEIMDTLKSELGVEEGEVTADGHCSYVHFECLGACELAPMAMIDDDYHVHLTPEKVRQILKELP